MVSVSDGPQRSTPWLLMSLSGALPATVLTRLVDLLLGRLENWLAPEGMEWGQEVR